MDDSRIGVAVHNGAARLGATAGRFAPERPVEGTHIVREAPTAPAAAGDLLAAELTRLRDVEAMQQEIFAVVSHELRTPLNAIIGFSEAAQHEIRGPLPEAYRGYFKDIGNVGRHLAAVLDTLLDLARLESGQSHFEVAPVAAARLVEEARLMVTARAEQHGVDIAKVAIDDECQVLVEPTRARQIVVNLLANAVAFTPRGGAVGVDATRASAGYLDLTVWDTGIGIPAAEQGRIFNAFYQIREARIARSATGGGSKGAGLGLAIARQLARVMGGDIAVQSTPGMGSRFSVRLKLAPG